MADELNTEQGNTGGATQPASAPVPTGDGSTPADKAKIDSFEKIDPNKLSPEELKHYKFFQGHFTKATQKFAEEKKDIMSKMQSFEQLLNDPMFMPLVNYKTTGKLPDGFDKNSFAAQMNKILGFTDAEPTQEEPNQPAEMNIDDSTKQYIQKAMADALKPLQQENQKLKAFVDKETIGRAENAMNEYRDSLKNDDPKLLEMFDKYVETGALSQALKSAPFNPDFKARLKYAFDGLAGDAKVSIAVEKSKSKLLEELKNKDSKERPVTGGSNGGVANVNPKDLKSILSQEIDKVMGS